MSSEKKPNSLQIIFDSYDSLINCVDILAELTLEKHRPNDFLHMFCSGLEPFQDRQMAYSARIEPSWFDILENPHVDSYTVEYELDDKYKTARVDPKKTTVHEYVNKMRQEMIDELRVAQVESLEWFKSKSQSTEPLQQLLLIDESESENQPEPERELFGNRYCFILKSQYFKGRESPFSMRPFKVYLFFLDFYINSRVKSYLREMISFHQYENFLPDYLSIHFLQNNGYEKLEAINQESILAHMIYLFVMQSTSSDLALGNHIFKIHLSQLKELNKYQLVFKCPQMITIDENYSFPNVKSLEIRAQIFSPIVTKRKQKIIPSCISLDGGVFSDLNFLALKNVRLKSFAELPNLRHLELKDCVLDDLSYDAFTSLPGLESLKISFSSIEQHCICNFDLRSLQQLHKLVLKRHENLKLLENLPSNLSILIIDGKISKDFHQFKHPNVQIVNLRLVDDYTNFSLSKISKEEPYIYRLLLAKLQNIKHLKLKFESNFNIFNQDCDYLSTLESLSLDCSSLKKISPFDLSCVSALSYFELLGPPPRASIMPTLCEPLSNLIAPINRLVELHLVSLQLNNLSLWRAFFGFKRLKKLNLSSNLIEDIDSMTFVGLENLSELNISDNCLKNVEAKTFLSVFPNLDRLVVSRIYENMEEEYKALFSFLSKSVSFV